jgi:hypothetical protein
MLIGIWAAVLILLFMSGVSSFAADRYVTLQWDPSIDAAYLQSYKIYYYTISGNVNSLDSADYAASYTVGGVSYNIDPDGPKTITIDKSYTEIAFHILDDSKAYYFVITAIDDSGLEGEYSTEYVIAANAAVVSNASISSSGESGGGGGCFIATAAFGSYLDPHVYVLRQFRDHVLLKNAMGKAFVKFYYKHSPPFADYIRQHDSLRMITRWALTPLIFGIQYPWMSAVLIIAMVAIIVYRRRQRIVTGDRLLVTG